MLHAISQHCMSAIDRAYRRYHALLPVGPLFIVGRRRHRGPARHFDDGTVLEPGEWVGTLHFDNARLLALDNGTGRHATAWQFGRLMRESLVALAAYSATSAGAPLVAYYGTTWMAPHGLSVGFSCEPLPAGWRRQWLRLHFGLLRRSFAPPSFRDARGRLEPRNFWITRPALQQHFGGGPH